MIDIIRAFVCIWSLQCYYYITRFHHWSLTNICPYWTFTLQPRFNNNIPALRWQNELQLHRSKWLLNLNLRTNVHVKVTTYKMVWILRHYDHKKNHILYYNHYVQVCSPSLFLIWQFTFFSLSGVFWPLKLVPMATAELPQMSGNIVQN